MLTLESKRKRDKFDCWNPKKIGISIWHVKNLYWLKIARVKISEWQMSTHQNCINQFCHKESPQKYWLIQFILISPSLKAGYYFCLHLAWAEDKIISTIWKWELTSGPTFRFTTNNSKDIKTYHFFAMTCPQLWCSCTVLRTLENLSKRRWQLMSIVGGPVSPMVHLWQQQQLVDYSVGHIGGGVRSTENEQVSLIKISTHLLLIFYHYWCSVSQTLVVGGIFLSKTSKRKITMYQGIGWSVRKRWQWGKCVFPQH